MVGSDGIRVSDDLDRAELLAEHIQGAHHFVDIQADHPLHGDENGVMNEVDNRAPIVQFCNNFRADGTVVNDDLTMLIMPFGIDRFGDLAVWMGFLIVL